MLVLADELPLAQVCAGLAREGDAEAGEGFLDGAHVELPQGEEGCAHLAGTLEAFEDPGDGGVGDVADAAGARDQLGAADAFSQARRRGVLFEVLGPPGLQQAAPVA